MSFHYKAVIQLLQVIKQFRLTNSVTTSLTRMEIENKIVLITGGANGIGFASCEEFLRNGAAHVAILDLRNSNGEEAASKLNAEFGKEKAIFIVCDVTKPQELEAGFAKTFEKFGGLDIVVNNAGIMDDSRWELMIKINYNAVVRGILLGFQYMGKDRGGKGGTIVNMSSKLGLITVASFPIYTGIKHAVIGLSRSFAKPYHYDKTGVRILTICPSSTETQLLTESSGRLLDIVEKDVLVKHLAGAPSQSVEYVAKGILHAIRVGETGSVWITERKQPIYEVDISDTPVKKVRN